LTSAHQKTGAIDSPLAFKIHSAFSHPCAGPMFRLPMLVAVFQIIEQARCRSANDCVQVERLYAHYDVGSITQELCNGGIQVRESGGINANEWRV
jgi:tetrahydromethanopterin S-methyltransferase subunit E